MEIDILDFLKNNFDFVLEEQFDNYYIICQNKAVLINKDMYNTFKELGF